MNKKVKLLLTIFFIGVIATVAVSQNTKPGRNSISPNMLPVITQEENGSLSFIESLRKREYEPGKITIERTLSNNKVYTGYLISYISDGLKIYGRMNIPSGEEPTNGFPVI